MNWNLATHGDKHERRFADYLEASFSSYELFWRTLIVPLTKRPHSIELRDDLPEPLRQMAEAHYSVFWHLTSAHRLLALAQMAAGDMRGDPASGMELLFDSIILHLGATREMAEHVLFVWAKLAAQADGRNMAAFTPLGPAEIRRKVEDYVSSGGYDRALAEFEKRGAPVGRLLHKEAHVFKPFLRDIGEKAACAYSSLDRKTGKLRNYRNVLAHESVRARAQESGTFLVLKPGKASGFDWERAASESEHDDWVEAGQLASGFLQDLEVGINRLWACIIPTCLNLERRVMGAAWREVPPADMEDLCASGYRMGEDAIEDMGSRPQADTADTSGSATVRRPGTAP